MEEYNIEMVGMSIFFVLSLIAVFWKGRRDAKVLRKVRIEDEDGTLRPLTREELSFMAQKMAHGRSWYFWYIIIGGIVVIALVALATRHWLPSR